MEAIDFVVRRLKDWHQQGHLTDRQLQTLSELYDVRRARMATASSAGQLLQPDATFSRRDECWSCAEYLYSNSSHCHGCGAPIANPGVRSLRYLRYLCRELEANEESGRLTLRQAHEFIGEIKERIVALQRKLERDRAPMVLPVDEQPEEPQPRHRPRQSEEAPIEEEGPRKSVLEILLDPESIQWLLAAGGGLIVLGLVIWLSSLGLFENARFVATLLGLGNAGLLALGYMLILRTSFQNAGRALTLLACLVMPLNLWFYHTNNLFTLEGQLWMPALVCCVVYAASAYVLRDALFVYVLVAGVSLTGLLILERFSIFEQVFAPSAMLVVLGLICLHAERAFPDIDGPFSRRQFGLAFFWCSLVLFALGLLLLLGAQIIGWLHEPIFRHLGMASPPDVATRPFLPRTLLLVLAGTYYYTYADLVVRRIGTYIYLAASTVLWAEILLLVMTDLAQHDAILIIALALTALAVNVLSAAFETQHAFLRRVPPLGLLLNMIPVALGVLLHFRATNSVLNDLWRVEGGQPFAISWGLAGAMAVTALCCRAGAFLYRHSLAPLSVAYFFATAAATLVFAAELTWMIGLHRWEQEAPLVMIVPILYLIASHLYRGHTPEKPLIWAAHGAVVIMLFCSIWVALGITPQVVAPIEGESRNLLLALYCLETAIFYGIAAFLRRTNWTIYLATIMLCGAIWQLLTYFHTPNEYYAVAFALSGFCLLIAYRFGVVEKWQIAGLERATFQSANALTTLGFTAGALLSLSRVFLGEAALAGMDPAHNWRNPIRTLMVVLIMLSIISLLSAWLVREQLWRRVYLVLNIVNVLLLVLAVHRFSALDVWQRLEIFTIVLGLLLLGVAYVGWYRETERSSDLVSFAFIFGSLGLVIPLFLASALHRFGAKISELDELALVAACVVLFGSGILCRVKATTIVGAAVLFVYVLMVLIWMHRFLRDTWIVGIYLTLGGVLLFGTGLFLSVYRDRLLALPDRIRRREGIFRIFDWR